MLTAIAMRPSFKGGAENSRRGLSMRMTHAAACLNVPYRGLTLVIDCKVIILYSMSFDLR